MTDGSGLRDAATDRRSRTERDEFADLVCAEPGWLDTEFAAIITANFGASAFDPDLPLPPHRDDPAASRPGRRQPAPTGPASATAHTRMTRRVGACERSPPLDRSNGDTRFARRWCRRCPTPGLSPLWTVTVICTPASRPGVS